MRRELTVSAGIHVAILVVAVIGFDWFSDDPLIDLDVVEIEFVDTIEEETQAPEEQPAPEPEPEPVRQAEAPAPEPIAVPEPRERPKVEPEPKPKPRPIPNVTPRAKPKPPSRLNTAALAALLDKRQEETEAEAKQKPTEPRPDIKINENRSTLDVARISAGVKQAIRSQIERCWSAPAGASYAETLIVRIQIFLRPDGSLARLPKILDERRMQRDQFFRAAAEAARRAVQKCAPLDLPRENYDVWREVVLNFDPSRML